MPINSNLIALHKQLGSKISEIENSFFYKNPIFIVSTPRSGSNLLFEQLSKINNIWTIGGESHGVFAQFPHLRFENNSLDSACLTANHADQQTTHLFKLALFSLLKDNKNKSANFKNIKNQTSAFIEKTPRNALNIPFLKSVFPHAKFIYLFREPKQNVASIIEAWKIGMETGQFATFPNLPGWDRKLWCLLLPRGWRKMNGKTLSEIAYFQWLESNKEIIHQLQKIPQSQWIGLEYKKLIKNPYKQLNKIIEFCQIEALIKKKNYKKLTLSKTSTSAPKKDKWRKHESQMKPLIKDMALSYKEIKTFVKSHK